MATVDRVPVAEGIFHRSEDGVVLVGSRCTGCGTHYFPRSPSCRNPACQIKSVEEVALGRSGRLHSYTVQSYQPPDLFPMEPFEPYVIGLVELPEGLRVLGMLTGVDPDDVRIDTPVELTTRTLRTTADGQALVTYAFTPSTEEIDS